MSDIIDSLKRLERVGSENSKTTEKLIAAAREISAKIVELVRPKNLEWKGEIEIIFQTIEDLHEAVPNHRGDWYFTGKYPTPGGYHVVNQAYVNYYEKHDGRSY